MSEDRTEGLLAYDEGEDENSGVGQTDAIGRSNGGITASLFHSLRRQIFGTFLNFHSVLCICHSLLWGNIAGRSAGGLHKVKKKRLNIKVVLL